MKTNRLLFILLLCSMCLAVSCVKKAPTYVPGEAPAGAQVFFPSSVPSGTIDLDESKSSISVPLNRVDASGALTVTINSEASAGFLIPSTADFAAGSNETTVEIGYDVSKLQRGEYYDVTLTVGSDSTPYGISDYHFVVYVNPWESLGYGQWFDQLALMSSSSLGIQDVEILHNGVEPQYYRIIQPYANDAQLAEAWSPDNLGGQKSEYIEFWITEDGVHVTWDTNWFCGLIYTPGDPSSMIKAYLPSALNSKYESEDAMSMLLNVMGGDHEFDVVKLTPRWYIDGLGGFGTYPCFLSMPWGPDLNDIL